MKKIFFTIAINLIGIIMIAQTKESNQRLKYITHAPDGSVSMTIYDEIGKDSMKLESVDDFYWYEILDPATSESIHTAPNRGKICEIDKTKIEVGTYDLRLFTNNFIITSKITITATRKFSSKLKPTMVLVATRE